MAYKVIILYRLYMPSYVLGTFTEYPDDRKWQNPEVQTERFKPGTLQATRYRNYLIHKYQ